MVPNFMARDDPAVIGAVHLVRRELSLRQLPQRQRWLVLRCGVGSPRGRRQARRDDFSGLSQSVLA
jgi:hypothetical protein